MSRRVTIEAHGSLSDFLSGQPVHNPPEHLAKSTYAFINRSTAKDAVESTGIPHVEVDLLLLDGTSVAFDREIGDGGVLAAFPKGHPENDKHSSYVAPPKLTEPKFLVDENSGKLANFLLLLGFDTIFDQRLDDPHLAELSAREKRILLTRDIGLLKRSIVVHGHWLRSDSPRQQIADVIRRYELWPSIRPFTRCLACNAELSAIEKEETKAHVPHATYAAFDEFFKCPSCQKIYWKGSHYDRMTEWLASLENELEGQRALRPQ